MYFDMSYINSSAVQKSLENTMSVSIQVEGRICFLIKIIKVMPPLLAACKCLFIKIAFFSSVFLSCDANSGVCNVHQDPFCSIPMRRGERRGTSAIMKLILPDAPWVINDLNPFKLLLSFLTEFMEMWEVHLAAEVAVAA